MNTDMILPSMLPFIAPSPAKKQKLTTALIGLGAEVITTVKSHLTAAIATEHAVLVMDEGGMYPFVTFFSTLTSCSIKINKY